MLEINDTLQDDNLKSEEILKKIKISKTDKNDENEIVRILVDCFKIPSEEQAIQYLKDFNVNIDESVKLISTDTGKIYGILLFGEKEIPETIPFFLYREPIISKMFKGIKQIQGLAFILDQRLRGYNLDKEMLKFQCTFLKDYEIAWCGVDNSLKTHDYWKKMGFVKFFSDKMVTFYLKLLKN